MRTTTPIFLGVFSRVALILFSFTACVSALQLALVLSIPAVRLSADVSDEGPLTAFLLSHIVGFTLTCLVFSIAAVIAAIGLRRNSAWSYMTWIGLLGLLIAWCILAITSEVYHVIEGQEPWASPGLLPSDRMLAATLVVPLSLIVAVSLLLLLRRFLSKPVREVMLRRD